MIRGWQSDAGFRSLFNALLADSPYGAFRWETPGITSDSVLRPFDYVLLDSPQLDRRPAPEAFAESFTDAKAGASWLHVRFDSRVKYYWFEPYKRPPAEPAGVADSR